MAQEQTNHNVSAGKGVQQKSWEHLFRRDKCDVGTGFVVIEYRKGIAGIAFKDIDLFNCLYASYNVINSKASKSSFAAKTWKDNVGPGFHTVTKQDTTAFHFIHATTLEKKWNNFADIFGDDAAEMGRIMGLSLPELHQPEDVIQLVEEKKNVSNKCVSFNSFDMHDFLRAVYYVSENLNKDKAENIAAVKISRADKDVYVISPSFLREDWEIPLNKEEDSSDLGQLDLEVIAGLSIDEGFPKAVMNKLSQKQRRRLHNQVGGKIAEAFKNARGVVAIRRLNGDVVAVLTSNKKIIKEIDMQWAGELRAYLPLGWDPLLKLQV